MAGIKISALTAASSIGLTDTFVIVQGGTTKKVLANVPWSIGRLTIDGGTATTDVALVSLVRTNNNAAVATGVKIVFTDTLSASGFLPLQILGGSGGATELVQLTKVGALFTPSYVGSKIGFEIDLTAAGDAKNGLINNGGPQFLSASLYRWSQSNTDANLAYDTNLNRPSAGVVAIGTTTANTLGTLSAAKVQSGAASNLVLAYNTTAEITIGNASTTVTSLAGAGSRAVLADANGLLSAPVSDRRWKENIKPIPYGLPEIRKLGPKIFNFKNRKRFGNQKYCGVIAQDVEKLMPELVGRDAKGVRYVNYEQFAAVLINAVRQLDARMG